MSTFFFTGFPGFIARELVKEIVQEIQNITSMYFLVLEPQLQTARLEVEKLEIKFPEQKGRFHLIVGDITKPSLGLQDEKLKQLTTEVNYVYHLAALYDLAVDRTAAETVNVKGTKHVSRWTATLPHLERYVYFSTAYVSGKREGRIYEKELDKGQSFKNHYEETKFIAEKVVSSYTSQIPTTIIRPGIVRGHSATGETIKFDGPYFMLNFFDRLGFLPVIPYLGAGNVDGNFVPVDYVIKATTYLSHISASIGKTYHLTDPSPLRMKEVYRLLMEEYLGKQPIGTVPLQSATYFLRYKKMRQWLGVEKESLAYFTYNAIYDTSQAEKDLEPTGIHVPSFKETLPSMVSYFKQFKADPQKKVKIN
ncbi:SDR family oxidoreductase [Alteribacter populi]|uniref:SDR family oxidoreductase n=1 Tax=Alteribacter populi TaxID=2011011 RepID=UPI000BBADF69|nr:SDR family oxidoreductase [Alteribacter populi]